MLVIALLIFSSAALYFTFHAQNLTLILAQFQPRNPPRQIPQLVTKATPVRATIAVNKPIPKPNPLLITYTVEHKSNSPVKTVPLKEAKLNVQVYYYGNPRGQITVVTNQDQSFTIGKFRTKSAVGLEVLSVEDENEYYARCKGYAAPGTTQITITCKQKRNS